MCYVHNQWYDISCATLYDLHEQFTRLQLSLKLQYRVTPPVGTKIYPKL